MESELELLRLVFDYSKKGKLADYNYIDRLVEIVVREKQIEKYVNNVKFTNTLEKDSDGAVIAAYRPVVKDIVIDYESVQLLMENKERYDCLFSTFEQIMFRNLTITQFILHELEHANQFKKADSKEDNSIETKLIKASFVLEQALKNKKFMDLVYNGDINAEGFVIYVLKNRELYKTLYPWNPTERLAQIKSYQLIVASIEQIKKYIPSLYEFKKASLVEQMLSGYDMVDPDLGTCPTEAYLKGTGQGELWQSFDFYNPNTNQLLRSVSSKYDLGRRLTLGLPINNGEYEDTFNWLCTTNKFGN